MHNCSDHFEKLTRIISIQVKNDVSQKFLSTIIWLYLIIKVKISQGLKYVLNLCQINKYFHAKYPCRVKKKKIKKKTELRPMEWKRIFFSIKTIIFAKQKRLRMQIFKLFLAYFPINVQIFQNQTLKCVCYAISIIVSIQSIFL